MKFFIKITLAFFLAFTLFAILIILTVFGGCNRFMDALGYNRPSEVAMEKTFDAKSQKFSLLLKLFQEDAGTVTYVGNGIVITSNEKLDRKRKALYLKYVKNLNCDAVYGDTKLTFWIWETGLTIASPSEAKGYAYIPTLGRYKNLIVSSIEEIEKSEKCGIWIKPIKNDWYIIYMRSR